MLCITYKGTLQNAAGVQPVHSKGSDKATGLQEAVLGYTGTAQKITIS